MRCPLIHQKKAFIGYGLLLIFLTGCNKPIDPDRPPDKLKGALLFDRPDEVIWLLCKPKPKSSDTTCRFFQVYSESHDQYAECEYDLKKQLDKESIKKIYFISDYELIDENGIGHKCR